MDRLSTMRRSCITDQPYPTFRQRGQRRVVPHPFAQAEKLGSLTANVVWGWASFLISIQR
ncbi:hypothetical protein [Rhizobium leguminosarum]|uniref:hypothetical protein n=1 Tax=Rhizobium leguminosarum TaxID=384 RepID=UPI00142E1194|nr:hypothetical protein [Rhizobium leguminosarum]